VTWVLVGVAAVAVFAIAAVVIGREARRLDTLPPRPVEDLEEAVAFVADRLPFEVAAQLTHDDVRRLVAWHLEYLRARGARLAYDRAPTGEPVVIDDVDALAQLLHRAERAGVEIDAAHASTVLDAHTAYLESIGAVAPADEPPRPS
jgi:hypothetical protein